MQGGKINRWGLRQDGAAPEYGDSYPLSVQRKDINGVAQYGVYSAVTGGFHGPLYPTSVEAETELHRIVQLSKGY